MEWIDNILNEVQTQIYVKIVNCIITNVLDISKDSKDSIEVIRNININFNLINYYTFV